MEPQEAERYVSGLPLWAKEKNTPDEIRGFLKQMGNPEKGMKIIHVAGTNGKGSVCMYMTQALLDAGLHTGTFLSPHLVRLEERILTDGKEIGREEFAEAADEVRRTAEERCKTGFHHPAYFEFLFYTAMLIIRKKNPDYIVLETGLGGRLDATNAVTPVLSVLTSISMDHMQILGDTIEKIAAEKAGIIKPGIPVVYDRNNPAAEKIILEAAAKNGSRAFGVDPAGEETEKTFGFLSVPYMRENAAVAQKALEVLPVSGGEKPDPGSFPSSVKRVLWKGRMEEIRPGIFLDGAHNADGMRAFCEAAEGICRQRNKKCRLLISAVADKDIGSMSAEIGRRLSPTVVYVPRLKGKRAADENRIAAALKKNVRCDIMVFQTAEEAWNMAQSSWDPDTVLFCAGSLYLIGELLTVIGKENGNDQL